MRTPAGLPRPSRSLTVAPSGGPPSRPTGRRRTRPSGGSPRRGRRWTSLSRARGRCVSPVSHAEPSASLSASTPPCAAQVFESTPYMHMPYGDEDGAGAHVFWEEDAPRREHG